MKTKEEILDKYTLWQGEMAIRTEENMLEAMEEYANQFRRNITSEEFLSEWRKTGCVDFNKKT